MHSSQSRACPVILYEIGSIVLKGVRMQPLEARYSIDDVPCDRRKVTEVLHIPGTGVAKVLYKRSGVEDHGCLSRFGF